MIGWRKLKNETILEPYECLVGKDIKIREIRCRAALVPSKIDGVDYCLNPYVGCEHGCIYCYAVFMKRYAQHDEEWGQFVDIKANLVERLAVHLKKARPGSIMLGTVTDAYQPLEGRMGLSRKCLELLSQYDFEVHIQTKSDLILRDLDLLKYIRNCWAGFTITTLDERTASEFEPRASKPSERLEALKILSENGVRTFAFVGPVIPFFSDKVESLRAIFQELEGVKAKKVYIDRMHYWGDRWERIRSFINSAHPELLGYYQRSRNSYQEYSAKLKTTVRKSLAGISLNCEILF